MRSNTLTLLSPYLAVGNYLNCLFGIEIVKAICASLDALEWHSGVSKVVIVMKWAAIVFVMMFLGGCADSHQLIKSNESAVTRLSPSDAIFIGVPEDGVYGTSVYRGSGQNTAQILYSAFAKHTGSVKVGNSRQTFDEALFSTRAAGHKYLLFPTILHWEDRATEWSSIPDKVELKLDLVDVASGNSIIFVIVKAVSGIATLGGDHPQDLLPIPVDEFVSSLY